ncbi:hypothetical protein [Paraburkholderia acidisoli]|uniref:hypothetical protein n=1 Tax=Paraburkholderia acidisoli TaxID=2571748 RepID=UPI0018EF1541|nr:hypothetical protein [Paraburkholderia acidisoli]
MTAFPELGHVGRVEGTPFIVVYRLKASWGDAALTILRILHGARRWPRRIE